MRIRPVRAGDEAAVASLWQYWFRDKTRTPEPGLADLARRLYLEHPNRDPNVSSLVAEGDSGEVLGFLGVTVTPVLLDGEPATLAGVFPPVVDPDASPTVASFLLRKFLTGPQALTFSDGGHVKYEPIWEALGGAIGQLQSLRWVKAFRPLELGATMLAERTRGAPWLPLARPLARGGDTLARLAAPARLRARPAAWRGEPLTPESLIDAVALVHAGARLRPAYSAAYLRWLLDEMAKARDQGRLNAELVRDDRGEVAGWHVAYLRPGGVGRVFALEGRERSLGGVIDHLFATADEAGCGALLGRLAPRLRRPMAARGCFVAAGGSLMMVHARDPRLVDDALLGRLALSRLEGENWYWWRIIATRPA